MRYVELHAFGDSRFVEDGFTHFVWCTTSGAMLPSFNAAFGFALRLDDVAPAPACFDRFNPATGQYASALADDAVPDLPPFYRAVWNNENRAWVFPPQDGDA